MASTTVIIEGRDGVLEIGPACIDWDPGSPGADIDAVQLIESQLVRGVQVRMEFTPGAIVYAQRRLAQAFGVAAQQMSEALLRQAYAGGQAQRAARIAVPQMSDAAARASLMEVLDQCTPAEVLTVQRELRAGRFEGLSPGSCLLGIVARCRGLRYDDIRLAWGFTTIEGWVMICVNEGMTPENNAQAALLDQWLMEWLEKHTLELPEQPARPLRQVRPVYRQRPAPGEPRPYLSDPDWRPAYVQLE